jgi:hypothetical protein
MPIALGKAGNLVALGPVLGSMDSSKILTEIDCSIYGVHLTAFVTRSADFNGAVHKNIIWRPAIEISLRLREPEIVVETTWRMRLTSGLEVDRAQTPGYRAQSYPITAMQTLRNEQP